MKDLVIILLLVGISLLPVPILKPVKIRPHLTNRPHLTKILLQNQRFFPQGLITCLVCVKSKQINQLDLRQIIFGNSQVIFMKHGNGWVVVNQK